MAERIAQLEAELREAREILTWLGSQRHVEIKHIPGACSVFVIHGGVGIMDENLIAAVKIHMAAATEAAHGED